MAIEFEDLPYSRLEEHAYFLKMLGVGDRLIKDVAHILEELGKDHRYPVPPHLLVLLPADLIPRRVSKLNEIEVADFYHLTHTLLQIRAAHGDNAAKVAGFAIAGNLRSRGSRIKRRRLAARSTMTDRELKKFVRSLDPVARSSNQSPDDEPP
ncbi:hypothetical protein [Agrobacterium pusense]|uniref:Uncharacterized protein n=1 Tax=Agrobacterium pusense TaxID=648995 RepID=A0AA44IX65_9HYPH|nr:hypothetical protein [Agrobacterium pusense]MDH2091964.1 hypothetical protein [Agrobacterium pusense]NRF07725.1 hypothetical protein [Agrobacterium pusense]NRF18022.1 hypothetical protein [Agrobacterium pusense]PZU78310.1 MAG: hypothetical protein DI546_03350 [Rhizobium sp.]